jgi:CP family cyanate transporter-like MFS transporter
MQQPRSESLAAEAAGSRHPLAAAWGHLVLLWLAGNCLRMTVLAVPPLLPTIHRALHLDEKLVGALTALPVLLLSGAAVLGSLLIAKLGARRSLILGLLVIAVAGAARGAGRLAPVLFLMTFLMGAGIAVSQPALPSLVRQWFPDHTGPATAIYSNGLLIGEIVAAWLTVPLIYPLVGHSWPLALAVWSIPVLLTAFAMLFWTPHVPREPGTQALRWWPDWRSSRTWRLGLILGCASITYFGSNAFIPDYLKATHHGSYITAALVSLNVGQLPASFLIAAFPRHLVRRRGPIVVMGIFMLSGGLGVALGGLWVVGWAFALGFASGMIFVLSLALPPLLAEEHDVHRLSAAMFAIGYCCSFVGSLLSGAIWDATAVPASAFTPIVIAGPLMILLTSRLRFHSDQPVGPSPSDMQT